jgi:hypothetical protein
MAYITVEEVKAVRAKLKKSFPAVKFSVRGGNSSSLKVSILESPIEINFESEFSQKRRNTSVNHYYINDHYGENNPSLCRLLNGVYEIMSENWWDKSDVMTDYFNCAYYMDLEIGRWNKPYIQTDKPRVRIA